MLVERSIYLAAGMDQCLQNLLSPRLFAHVSWPIMRFVPLDPPVMPVQWDQRKYLVKMRLFGCIPFGSQTINVSLLADKPGHVLVRDNGYGSLIKRWDHRITLISMQEGTLYTDRVEIQAGFLTPVVWVFASLFFRHRQRRWRALVNSGFKYPGS